MPKCLKFFFLKRKVPGIIASHLCIVFKPYVRYEASLYPF